MTRVFNPPPNWPPSPAGWSPPPDWRPNPIWGPAPIGWKFWVDVDERSGAPAESAGAEVQRVFISYRRSDCQPQANGLHDGLTHRLKSATIFMDIDSIPAGADFEQHIREEIQVCDLVLVLVGDNWLDARPDSNTRRIDEADDFVRLEIESALASPNVRVIPVLVEGAEMPRAGDLPESIRRLARINAIELSDRRWTADLERLAATIERFGPTRRTQAQGAVNQTSRADAPPPRPDLRRAPLPGSPVPAEPVGFTRVNPVMDAVAHTPGLPPVPYTGPPERTVSLSGQDPRAARQRTPVLGWIVIILPLLTIGLASFVPPLWAASRRRHDRRFRRVMFISAAALGALSILGFGLIGSDPQNPEATLGPRAEWGFAIWFGCVVVATGIAVRHRKSRTELPGTAEELARREQREQYRSLIRRDPNLARSMGVGRPDLERDFSDGGLLDFNALSVEALSRFGPMPEDEARRIVEVRRQLHRLTSVDQLVMYVSLPEATTMRLRESAVFL